MTGKRISRFWQIHLSTAIVLMLVTGVLLGANCVQVTHSYDEVDQSKLNYAFRHVQPVGGDYRDHTFVLCEQGWPYASRICILNEEGRIMPYYSWGNEWRFQMLAVDVFIGIVLCGSSGVISEWFIRRGENRKP